MNETYSRIWTVSVQQHIKPITRNTIILDLTSGRLDRIDLGLPEEAQVDIHSSVFAEQWILNPPFYENCETLQYSRHF